MAIRYDEQGGLSGYKWVSLPAIPIGSIVYFRGRDVQIERIEITSRPFTRTEPIVYVHDLATLKPDSFQCESETASLLLKEVKETEIKRFHEGRKQITFASDRERLAISIQTPSDERHTWPVIQLDSRQVQKLLEWLQEQANG